jgi:hypothetical protein
LNHRSDVRGSRREVLLGVSIWDEFPNTENSVTALIVETTAVEPHPGFRGDPQNLLTFLSFGAAERYGSLHPLSGVANLLRRRHNVDVTPLFEFSDAVPDDELDERELERLWQEPGPLAQSAAGAAAAIRANERLASLAREFPDLPDLLDDLATIARWAQARDARVRITYRL